MKVPFTFTRDDKVIRGDVYIQHGDYGDTKKPVVIICHGFKGFKDWGMFPRAATYLADQGFVVVTFNFSGNGIGEDLENFTELESFGHNTYEQEQLDLDFIVNKVINGEIPLAGFMDRQRLALLGHSKGGGNAILYAANHPFDISAVVTWNGIANVDIFGEVVRKQIQESGIGYIENARTKQRMPIYPVVLEDIDRHRDVYNLPNRVAELKQPILIVQARKDFDRLVKGAMVLIEKAKKGKLVWIEEAGHTFNTTHPYREDPSAFMETLNLTIAFLKEELD